MLQIAVIRENQEAVIKALAKRNWEKIKVQTNIKNEKHILQCMTLIL